MPKLVNRAKMTTATTGTGTITLGSAVDGYQTFADAGVVNSDVVRYVIEDGDAWEIGLGTYTASGTTLTRGSIESSNADAALNLTGNAVVFVSAAAADLQELVDFADNFVLPTADGSTGQVLQTNGAGTLSFTTITGYTDADVDTHLNTGTAASGEVLSWTGTDYDWVTVAAGATDIDGLSDGYYSSQSLGLGTGAMVNNSGSFLGNTAVGYYAGNLTSTGNLNTFIGREAGDTNTTGRWNTFVGANTSGNSATVQDAVAVGYNSQATSNAIVVGSDAKALGSGQVSIGDEAGRSSNSSANESVLIGRAAGQYVQGSRNIGIGSYSLFSFGTFSLTGTDNVALGYQTGYDLSTGANNFLGGYRAGYDLTTGSNNVAIGNGALDAATTGGRNIAIGQGAMGLGVATAASGDNVAIGYQAGYDLTSGVHNLLVGNISGTNLTSGRNNTSLGFAAMRFATTGGYNIAIGDGAMSQGITTASNGYNVAIGANSGEALTSGITNTLLGNRTGNALTTGSDNVAIGSGALDAATTGGRNIAIGQDAMGLGVATAASGDNIGIGYLANYRITSATNNIALGRSSLSNATSGGSNLAIGTFALTNNSTGTNNVAIGQSAGQEALNSNNVFLGHQAGDATTTGSNQIVIGQGSDASSATVSNEITLGNTSITRFRVPGAGIDNTSAALSGTTPSVDVGARDTYTLTTSGNTTFTFTGAPSSGQVGTFSLIITAGGTHTLTWPASVDWAGGTAPDAPASGEKDIYTFMTVDGGTTWYGFLAGDAMA